MLVSVPIWYHRHRIIDDNVGALWAHQGLKRSWEKLVFASQEVQTIAKTHDTTPPIFISTTDSAFWRCQIFSDVLCNYYIFDALKNYRNNLEKITGRKRDTHPPNIHLNKLWHIVIYTTCETGNDKLKSMRSSVLLLVFVFKIPNIRQFQNFDRPEIWQPGNF